MSKDNPDATKYYILTPDGKEISFIGRKNVMEYIGCSTYFFVNKKYKNYKLIKKEKINR